MERYLISKIWSLSKSSYESLQSQDFAREFLMQFPFNLGRLLPAVSRKEGFIIFTRRPKYTFVTEIEYIIILGIIY